MGLCAGKQASQHRAPTAEVERSKGHRKYGRPADPAEHTHTQKAARHPATTPAVSVQTTPAVSQAVSAAGETTDQRGESPSQSPGRANLLSPKRIRHKNSENLDEEFLSATSTHEKREVLNMIAEEMLSDAMLSSDGDPGTPDGMISSRCRHSNNPQPSPNGPGSANGKKPQAMCGQFPLLRHSCAKHTTQLPLLLALYTQPAGDAALLSLCFSDDRNPSHDCPLCFCCRIMHTANPLKYADEES